MFWNVQNQIASLLISRLINKEAIWFWTFQNTYYAISTAKVKGLPKMYSGVIDVSRAWKE